MTHIYAALGGDESIQVQFIDTLHQNGKPLEIHFQSITPIYVWVILLLADIQSKVCLDCNGRVTLTADAGAIPMHYGHQSSVSRACVQEKSKLVSFEI